MTYITANPIRDFAPRKALEILPLGPKDEILQLLNSTRAISSAGSVETIYTDVSLNVGEAIEEEQDAMDL